MSDQWCKQILVELLDVYNSIPFKSEIEFLPFDEWLRINYFDETLPIPAKNQSDSLPGLIAHSPGKDFDFSNPGIEEAWVNQFRVYPTLFKFLVYDSEGETCNLRHADENLQVFLHARLYFHAFEKYYEFLSHEDFYTHLTIDLPAASLFIFHGQIEYHEQIFIANSFRLMFQSGFLLERIRACKYCKKLYVAKRTDAIYCSRKCVNAFHQKNWLNQSDNRERVNEQRRDNYDRKRKFELIKSSNGSL